MKKTITLILAAAAMSPVLAGNTDIGVSIGINQPGMYGRIDIGNTMYGHPQLVYPQPVIIAPPAVAYERRPIYMYVPTAHQSNWRRYCGRYQACGQPVYFVQERWVRDRWQHEHPGHGHGHGHGHGKHDKHDKHDKHGHGHGHGKHGRD